MRPVNLIHTNLWLKKKHNKIISIVEFDAKQEREGKAEREREIQFVTDFQCEFFVVAVKN